MIEDTLKLKREDADTFINEVLREIPEEDKTELFHLLQIYAISHNPMYARKIAKKKKCKGKEPELV